MKKTWLPAFSFALFLGLACYILSLSEKPFWREVSSSVGPLTRLSLTLERSWYDLKSRGRPMEKAQGVVVATVDDASLKRFGRWPWSRAIYAEILERLYAAGASVVAFDAVFAEPELNQEIIRKSFLEPIANLNQKSLVSSLGLNEKSLDLISQNLPEIGDRIFARAIGKYPRTTLGYIWLFDRQHECPLYDANNAEDQKRFGNMTSLEARSKGLLPSQDHEDSLGSLYSQSFSQKNLSPFTPENRGNIFMGYCLVGNRSSIAALAKHSGAFNTIHDDDGIVRRAQLLFGLDPDSLSRVAEDRKFYFPPEWFGHATFFPSLALRALMSHWNASDPQVKVEENKNGQRQIRNISMQLPGAPTRLEIPTLPDGSLMLHFYGRQDREDPPIPSFSLADLDYLADRDFQRKFFPTQEGPRALENQIVIIGPTALGVYDIRPTAIQQNSPGVYVHATAISRLLEFAKGGRTPGMVQVPWVWVSACFVVGALLLMILSLNSHFWAGLLLSFTGIAFLPIADIFIFNRWSWVFPMATFMMLLFWLVFMLALYRYFTEEKQKSFVKSAFQKYVSPEVVQSIINHPENLNLGGKKQQVSILFSDIRGFTSLAEKMEAAALSQFLNEYLSEMTDIILRHGGTIDKYIGDAIMAIFGAPVPFGDHAARAVRASLEMNTRVAELNRQWKEQGRPTIEMGVGIHSGEASVGNMGSKQIFSYTAVGDTVNLASRIESLTKLYGVPLLCSWETLQQKGSQEGFWMLDCVKVVGKNIPVKLYTSENSESEKAAAAYGVAFGLYSERRFKDCLQQLKDWQGFKPAANLSRRCELFISRPPEADWDGSWTIQEK